MMKNFETMTVKELREESRERGLTLESKGKRFTKVQLIERLTKWEKEQEDINNDIQKAIDEAGEEPKCEDVKTCKDCNNSPCENTPEVKEIKGNKFFATTIEEIEQKYGREKPEWVYEEELQIGTTVVFVQYVSALNGWMGKKLRTAKVVAINRKKRLVRVETFFGTEFELRYEDLLSINREDEQGFKNYPLDIRIYLKKQRMENQKMKGKNYERLQ